MGVHHANIRDTVPYLIFDYILIILTSVQDKSWIFHSILQHIVNMSADCLPPSLAINLTTNISTSESSM